MRRRAFAGDEDARALQAFTAKAISDHGRVGMLHPGDVVHHIYNGMRHENPHELVHIWEDDTGEILAWTLLDPRRSTCDPQINRTIRQTVPSLEREINEWSEQTLVRLMAGRGSEATDIWTDASANDQVRVDMLESSGWVAQDDDVYMLTRRSIDGAEPPELPEGYYLRSVTGVEEAGPVAELHKATFGAAWTTELYARVMNSPGYSPDRELLVVAPDGQLAAFCVLWPDDINKTGLFEPVAVHPDHRRLGLGGALMRAGMEAMRSWGMIHAEVMYEMANPGSGALYRGEGFVPIDKIITYGKSIAGSPR